MDVKLRVLTCLVLEQMDKNPEHAKELSLENDSVFLGDREILFGGVKK